MVLQVQVTDGLLDDRSDLVGSNALHEGVELDRLLNRQCREDSIMLWAVADQVTSFCELLLDVVALNGDLASRRRDVSSQTLESCRLAGTIDTEQSEALTVVEAEGSLLDGADRSATERIVLFLEVVNTNTVDVTIS